MDNKFNFITSFPFKRILEMKSWYNLRQENYQDNGTEKEKQH